MCVYVCAVYIMKRVVLSACMCRYVSVCILAKVRIMWSQHCFLSRVVRYVCQIFLTSLSDLTL